VANQVTSFVPKVSGEVPWEVAHHITLLYQKLNGIAQAVVQAHTAAQSTTTIEQITAGGGSSGGGGSAVVGAVNDQAGVTAYTTMPSDNGALIIFDDASPIAVTLGISASVPWFCVLVNMGAGLATLTPASGTISYVGNPAAASMPLSTGMFAWVGFDGSEFWAAVTPLVPSTFAAVTHEFLTSYNSATGVFSASAPVIGDVTGLSGALALLAPIASPTFTGTVTQPTPSVITAATTATSATAGAATALPATPSGYLVISLNGTNFKVPFFAV
jgi:hypothetical protein